MIRGDRACATRYRLRRERIDAGHRPRPVPSNGSRSTKLAGLHTDAIDLIAWAQTILLHDQPDLAKAEPKTLRYRLLHVAARLVRRTTTRLKIDRTWRWAHVLAAAFHRLHALPVPTT